jgi:hypothetical protein
MQHHVLLNGLTFKQLAQISELLLPHIPLEAKLLNTDTEVWLNRLRTKKCGDFAFPITPSDITGYDLSRLGMNYAFGTTSGAKSKKSRTGILSVIENDSIDSKEGAFNPRSTRLRKSTEISRSSANCS